MYHNIKVRTIYPISRLIQQYSKNSIMTKMTNREEEIMNIFWDKGPLFVRELLTFYSDPKPHFNTLSTMVRTLEEKKLIGHEAFGRSFKYHAIVDRDQYGKKTLKGIINKYFNNSYLEVVSMLVKDKDLSDEEIANLIKQVRDNESKI